jgi:phytoene dehydrogenase-like protein
MPDFDVIVIGGGVGGLSKRYLDIDLLYGAGICAYFVGLPPALCLGSIAFFAYSKHERIFYPWGGIIEIPKTIAKLFEGNGGEVRFNTRVNKVLMENGEPPVSNWRTGPRSEAALSCRT